MSDATLETALRSLYTAMLAHDIAALERLLTEDSVYIHSTGLAETRGEFSNGVRDGL